MSDLFDALIQVITHPADLVYNKYLMVENSAPVTPNLTKPLFARYATPFDVFGFWFTDAKKSELNDPNAMNLSTISENGLPKSRIVLMKDYDESGFVFYTNLHSNKGKELLRHPYAALGFHWKSLRRQVRVEGKVTQVSDAEADEYFHTRPYLSQIGAWASDQSAPLAKRDTLLARVGEFQHRYPEGKTPVPRPAHWNGFRLEPNYFEFWHDRPYRLHERLVFSLNSHGASGEGVWKMGMLYP